MMNKLAIPRLEAEYVVEHIVSLACKEHDYTDDGHNRLLYLVSKAIDWFKVVEKVK